MTAPLIIFLLKQILLKTEFWTTGAETVTLTTMAFPLKRRFPTFHYRASSFCCLPIFSSLEPSKSPPKDEQDFNRF